MLRTHKSKSKVYLLAVYQLCLSAKWTKKHRYKVWHPYFISSNVIGMNGNNKLELRKINIFKCKRPENQDFKILLQLYTTGVHNKTFWAEISNATDDTVLNRNKLSKINVMPVIPQFLCHVFVLWAIAVNHTFTCVTAVYREVWICYIISTHAGAIVTPNSVVADWVWTTDIWYLNTFIHIYIRWKLQEKEEFGSLIHM